MSKTTKIIYTIIGIVLTLTQVLGIVLKLCGVSHISWFATLMPLLVAAAFLFLVVALFFVCCICVAKSDKEDKDYYI